MSDGGDIAFTEVSSMLERWGREAQQNLQETDNSYVSRLSVSGLKRFSSMPLLDQQHCYHSPRVMGAPPPCTDAPCQRIPIIGYEVIEERARFTVYKLRISNENFGKCWYVFRRYTDFLRLHSKLKAEFKWCKLKLPRKCWFGNNFDSHFINDRLHGLQSFIDTITGDAHLVNSSFVREFFCLDQPPSYLETSVENRAIFEALEETVYKLRQKLIEKEHECESLRALLSVQHAANDQCSTDISSSSASLNDAQWANVVKQDGPCHVFSFSPLPTSTMLSPITDKT